MRAAWSGKKVEEEEEETKHPEPVKHDDGRPPFWKRFSAPPKMAGVDPVMSGAREPQPKKEGTVAQGIRRIMSIGIAKPKPGPDSAKEQKAGLDSAKEQKTVPESANVQKSDSDSGPSESKTVQAAAPTLQLASGIPTPPTSP